MTLTRTGMISKKEYEELKPYYDYQRKVAYNKEKIYEMAHKFNGRMFDTSGVLIPATLVNTYGIEYHQKNTKNHLKIGYLKMRSTE